MPAAQFSTTALAVVEHCVVMRLPAEVPVHVLGHAVTVFALFPGPKTEDVLDAEYVFGPHTVHVRSAVRVAAAE